MESIANRMGRFESKKHDSLVVPRLPINQQAISASKASRFPASVTHKKTNFVKSFNNKKLYFSTLMQQYVKLQGYTYQNAPKVTSCPHFHTTYLKLKDSHIISSVTKHSWDKKYSDTTSEKLISHNPELALPVTFDSHGPRVIDLQSSNKKDSVQKALVIYLEKMHTEINLLCQNGATDNYYTFENLQTSEDTKLSKATVDSMTILLKSPIYLNELLIKSLSKAKIKGVSRKIASTHENRVKNIDIFYEVNARLKTRWFETYINKL